MPRAASRPNPCLIDTSFRSTSRYRNNRRRIKRSSSWAWTWKNSRHHLDRDLARTDRKARGSVMTSLTRAARHRWPRRMGKAIIPRTKYPMVQRRNSSWMKSRRIWVQRWYPRNKGKRRSYINCCRWWIFREPTWLYRKYNGGKKTSGLWSQKCIH